MAAARSSELKAGERNLLQEFQLIQILGSGGFGVAIKARNTSTGSEVAIKLIPEETNNSHWSLKALRNEVHMIAKISNHPNVVEYKSCWKQELDAAQLAQIRVMIGKTNKLSLPPNVPSLSLICIEMELCSCTLKPWLKSRQTGINPRTSYKVFAQLVDGLEHIHNNGLLHRDLKPTNVLIHNGGTNLLVKIGDFGLAVLHNQNGMEYHTTNAGNALYKAPEQEGKKYGSPVDIYALGLILYELFDQNTQLNIQKSLTFLKYNKKLPADLENNYPTVAKLILEMISYEPDDRPKFMKIRETIAAARAGERASFSEDEPDEEDRNLVIDELMGMLLNNLETMEINGCIASDCSACRRRLDFPRYKCCTCKDLVLCKVCEDAIDKKTLSIIGHSNVHQMLKLKRNKNEENSNANANVLKYLHDLQQFQAQRGSSQVAAAADKIGCKHYRRKCQLHCVTCNEYFSCRLCHDEARGREHAFNRFQVGLVKCSMCSTPQLVGNKCGKCGVEFAKYFCSICHLYDDSENAAALTWHCDKCGICRKKAEIGLKYGHCDDCCMCYPESVLSHECKPNAGKSTCSFCKNGIFDSIWPAALIPCGHYIHKRCLERFRADGAHCLACGPTSPSYSVTCVCSSDSDSDFL